VRCVHRDRPSAWFGLPERHRVGRGLWEGLVSWAWAVNGAASVIGSILAVVAALSIGFSGVGFLAAACYLVAAVPVATRVWLRAGAEASPQPT
jgi:hypothetical protein